MTEGTSLDDLLNAEPEAAEAVPEPVEEPQADKARDPDTGKFVSTKGVEPDPETEQETVPPTDKLPKEEYKAIKEEREKRQTIERELEALKAQFQQLTQPVQQEPPPSVWEDENAWGGHLVNTAVTQAETRSRVLMSEMLMRQSEADFEDLKATYFELERSNPAIAQQVMADPHPWNKAIQIAKSHKAMQELGATNVEEMREKLKAELLAELQQGQTPVAGKPALPVSLTGERSVASRTGPEWSGPTPLSSLLR